MFVLFCFSFVCLHVCVYAFKSKVHCGSAFEPGACGLPYYCTQPVCVQLEGHPCGGITTKTKASLLWKPVLPVDRQFQVFEGCCHADTFTHKITCVSLTYMCVTECVHDEVIRVSIHIWWSEDMQAEDDGAIDYVCHWIRIRSSHMWVW